MDAIRTLLRFGKVHVTHILLGSFTVLCGPLSLIIHGTSRYAIYAEKWAHGSCFVMFCCGMLPISLIPRSYFTCSPIQIWPSCCFFVPSAALGTKKQQEGQIWIGLLHMHRGNPMPEVLNVFKAVNLETYCSKGRYHCFRSILCYFCFRKAVIRIRQ